MAPPDRNRVSIARQLFAALCIDRSLALETSGATSTSNEEPMHPTIELMEQHVRNIYRALTGGEWRGDERLEPISSKTKMRQSLVNHS
jgi:hypothetical protein